MLVYKSMCAKKRAGNLAQVISDLGRQEMLGARQLVRKQRPASSPGGLPGAQAWSSFLKGQFPFH